MMTLTIRKYQSTDFDRIHDFILKTWYVDSAKQDSDVTDAFVTVDLNYHLHNSSFGLTAELDGEVVGVLLGNVSDEPKHMRLYKREILPALQKFFEKESNLSKQLIDSINKEHQANDELNKRLDTPYQGKVQLFIVDSSKRGQNIGGSLWKAGQKYFSEAGVERFILHTDSECDYSYYEALGMNCVDPITVVYENEKGSVEYMLFHGNVKKVEVD